MKNDLSFHSLSVEDARCWRGQTTLEVIGSKRSCALKWCKPNNDDADDVSILSGTFLTTQQKTATFSFFYLLSSVASHFLSMLCVV